MKQRLLRQYYVLLWNYLCLNVVNLHEVLNAYCVDAHYAARTDIWAISSLEFCLLRLLDPLCFLSHEL